MVYCPVLDCGLGLQRTAAGAIRECQTNKCVFRAGLDMYSGVTVLLRAGHLAR